MNKKKLILIRGGLFASSLPLIAASCKNNELNLKLNINIISTPLIAIDKNNETKSLKTKWISNHLLLIQTWKNWSQSKWRS
nr:variable surface lipoprotein [Mycoplasmopsis bovis]